MAAARAKGVAYIGRGYNLIFGNPDFVSLGDEPTLDATDPGITSNFVLNLTWFTMSVDRGGM